DPWEAQRTFVHQVPRFPPREELRVEPIETLDLEERVGPAEPTPEQTLRRIARVIENPRERGEVQRNLLDALLAEVGESFGDHVLGQPVRRLAVASHE